MANGKGALSDARACTSFREARSIAVSKPRTHILSVSPRMIDRLIGIENYCYSSSFISVARTSPFPSPLYPSFSRLSDNPCLQCPN